MISEGYYGNTDCGNTRDKGKRGREDSERSKQEKLFESGTWSKETGKCIWEDDEII